MACTRPPAQVLERRGVASDSDQEGPGGPSPGKPGANGADQPHPHRAKSTGALPVGGGGGGGGAPRGAGLAAAAKAALRGVEPELFNPEDLLAATGGMGGAPHLVLVCWYGCVSMADGLR